MEIETANEPKLTEGQKLRRQRERQRRQAAARRTRRILAAAAVLICAVGVIGMAVHFSQSQSAKAEAPTAAVKKAAAKKIRKSRIPAPPKETADTVKLDKEIVSKYAILIDLKTNTVIAEKNPDAVISPASMTKIMTVLVAAERQKDLNARAPSPRRSRTFATATGAAP